MKSEESAHFCEPLSDGEWNGALVELRHGISSCKREQMLPLALGIRKGIEALDGVMTDYCGITCPSCQDPCCHGRRVFFNRADLIYLTVLGGSIPPGQTRAHPNDPCRYLASGGCLLSRTVRPYVCVWFLCDPQMCLFRAEKPSFQRRFIATMQEIRQYRLGLESCFEA